MDDENYCTDTSDLPNLDCARVRPINPDSLKSKDDPGHPPRILALYGSLRTKSYSLSLARECIRLLELLGAEAKSFDPTGLPLPDTEDDTHPKVIELRNLVNWCEGMVWVSPERHGSITGIMKSQIDWIPLALGSIRPTQGKTLALLQISGGSQSFNTVSQMRILGRWMRMLTIPNQSSVPKVALEFDENGRMKPSPFYNRVVDVMEELVKFTWLVRSRNEYLLDRYSERVHKAEQRATTVSIQTT